MSDYLGIPLGPVERALRADANTTAMAGTEHLMGSVVASVHGPEEDLRRVCGALVATEELVSSHLSAGFFAAARMERRTGDRGRGLATLWLTNVLDEFQKDAAKKGWPVRVTIARPMAQETGA